MPENEENSWIRTFVIILIVIIGFGILVSLLGSGAAMMGGGMMGGGMMGFGWLFMLLPIIFIIFLINALSGRETNEPSQPSYYGRESPMEVLERRYASGEISRGDYLRMKDDLKRR